MPPEYRTSRSYRIQQQASKLLMARHTHLVNKTLPSACFVSSYTCFHAFHPVQWDRNARNQKLKESIRMLKIGLLHDPR